MGRIQRLGPAEVRERALATAIAKHDEGCENCAAAYITVARANGATEADVRRAAVGRRRFLKFALATLAATGVGAGILIDHLHTASSAMSPVLPRFGNGDLPGAYGVDSCTPVATATGQAMPLQFYIGEVGATANGLNCFDRETAAAVGPDLTHGYWGVCGPNNTASLFAYGQEQALRAVEAVAANGLVSGRTLFADVETGFGGWGDPATSEQHAALLDAWLKTVAAAGYIPGVYISDSNRDAWFPSGYRAAVPFVYWVAGGPHAGTMCAPCQSNCDTLASVHQLWDDHVSRETFAGYRAVLWQYWLSDFGCGGDYNFSPQRASNALLPVSTDYAPLTSGA